MRLLLIECDGLASGWLEPRLAEGGFFAHCARSPGEALSHEMARNTAAILVETGEQGPEGGRLVEQLRFAGLSQPIVLVSARANWREKVACLDAGADDYIVKPARAEEVCARLRASIRRSMGSPTDRWRIGPFELDISARCAWLGGKCLDLTRNEFRLLRYILLNPDRIIAPDELRNELYQAGPVSLNAIEVQIARMRKKIGRDVIRTVRGLGYRCSPNAKVADQESSQIKLT